jgi:hypothetical protein
MYVEGRERRGLRVKGGRGEGGGASDIMQHSREHECVVTTRRPRTRFNRERGEREGKGRRGEGKEKGEKRGGGARNKVEWGDANTG